MPSKAEKYFHALLALSGDPLFTQSRQDLLARVADDDLEELVKYALAREFSRDSSEKILTSLLDIIKTEKKEAKDISGQSVGEVIKIEDDDIQEISAQDNDQGTASLGTALRNSLRPRPAHQADTLRARKRKGSVELSKEPRKQKRLGNDGVNGTMASSHTERDARPQASSSSMVFRSRSNETQPDQDIHQPGPTSSLTPSPAPRVVPDNEMVAWVPEGVDQGKWQKSSSFPHSLMVQLQDKITSDYKDKPKHANTFSAMLASRERYVDTLVCANRYVVHKLTGTNTWGKADGNTRRACDACIRSKRLCVRLVKVKGYIRLAVFPIPGLMRLGKSWRQVGYWVRE